MRRGDRQKILEQSRDPDHPFRGGDAAEAKIETNGGIPGDARLGTCSPAKVPATAVSSRPAPSDPRIAEGLDAAFERCIADARVSGDGRQGGASRECPVPRFSLADPRLHQVTASGQGIVEAVESHPPEHTRTLFVSGTTARPQWAGPAARATRPLPHRRRNRCRTSPRQSCRRTAREGPARRHSSSSR